jgi:hypothetical protein
MPEINHYEVTVQIRFEVDGPLAYHEAVELAEARAAKALTGDVPPHSDPVKSAKVTSISAERARR